MPDLPPSLWYSVVPPPELELEELLVEELLVEEPDVDDVDEAELEEPPELDVEEPPALELEEELDPLPGAVPAVQPCSPRAAEPNAMASALSARLFPVRCIAAPPIGSVAL